jgi:hypothetical protein
MIKPPAPLFGNFGREGSPGFPAAFGNDDVQLWSEQ